MHNAFAVAPRQNLASLLLFMTWALHDGGDRPDQMMAHTTLALHPLAFLPAAEPKLAISFSDVIHPAMCLGPWHLQWFADSKTGSQPWKPGWK